MDSKENTEKDAPFSPANCIAAFFTRTVARMMPSLLARYRFFSHDRSSPGAALLIRESNVSCLVPRRRQRPASVCLGAFGKNGCVRLRALGRRRHVPTCSKLSSPAPTTNVYARRQHSAPKVLTESRYGCCATTFFLKGGDAHSFFIRLFTTPCKKNYKDRTEATKLTTAR
jgi:hypothetical protein